MKIKYSHTDSPPQLVNGSNADNYHYHSVLTSNKCSLETDDDLERFVFKVNNIKVAEYLYNRVSYSVPLIMAYDAYSSPYGHDNIDGVILRYNDELVTYHYGLNAYLSLVNVGNYIYGRTANITPTTETSLSSVTSNVTTGIVFYEDAFVESIDFSYTIVTSSTYRAVLRYRFSGVIKYNYICTGSAGNSYTYRIIRPLNEILPGRPSGNVTPLHQFTIYNVAGASSSVDTLSNISIRLQLRAAYRKN